VGLVVGNLVGEIVGEAEGNLVGLLVGEAVESQLLAASHVSPLELHVPRAMRSYTHAPGLW